MQLTRTMTRSAIPSHRRRGRIRAARHPVPIRRRRGPIRGVLNRWTSRGCSRPPFWVANDDATLCVGKCSDPPEGLVYRADLLSEAEERELLDHLLCAPGVRGDPHEGRRRPPDGPPVRDGLRLRGQASAIPGRRPFAGPGCSRCGIDAAVLARGPAARTLVQALVQRYPPGAPIGWHRDSPSNELVAGVSVLRPPACGFGAARRTPERCGRSTLAPALCLRPRLGVVRWKWEHQVPTGRGPSLLDHVPFAPRGSARRASEAPRVNRTPPALPRYPACRCAGAMRRMLGYDRATDAVRRRRRLSVPAVAGR